MCLQFRLRCYASTIGVVRAATRFSSSHSATRARNAVSSLSQALTTRVTVWSRTPRSVLTACSLRQRFCSSRANPSGSPEIAKARKQSLQLCPVALRPRVTRSGPNASNAVVSKALSAGLMTPSSPAFELRKRQRPHPPVRGCGRSRIAFARSLPAKHIPPPRTAYRVLLQTPPIAHLSCRAASVKGYYPRHPLGVPGTGRRSERERANQATQPDILLAHANENDRGDSRPVRRL